MRERQKSEGRRQKSEKFWGEEPNTLVRGNIPFILLRTGNALHPWFTVSIQLISQRVGSIPTVNANSGVGAFPFN